MLEKKIQIEVLKRLEKKLPVSYASDNDHIYLTADGKSAVKIPNDSFFLDKSKIKENKSLIDIFNVSTEDLYKLKETNYTRKYNDGITKRFYVVENYDNVYVNKKLLKKFSFERTEFFASKNTRFVYLALDKEIYALVLSIPFCKPEEYEC